VIVFDPSYPEFDESRFVKHDWGNFYGKVKEAIPPNAPLDADHAGDKLTRRSRTGIITYMNMAPIVWHSKRQNSVKTSTFGLEFVAMKVATERLKGLRYKLRMMGVPLSGPSYLFGDNQSVISNTTAPESQLKKKSNSIAYHCVRESVASGELLTAYENTEANVSDIMTKCLSGGERRTKLVRRVLYAF
jgi:hypothetical protein